MVFDADLVHEVTPEPPSPGVPSELYVEVSPLKVAGWSFTGQVTSNAYFSTPFVANWWRESKEGVMKMSTDIPSSTFLQAHASLLTRLQSDLGRLLGRNNYTQFGSRQTDFDIRGEFVSGVMSVTVK